MIEWVLVILLLPIGAYLSSQSRSSKSTRMRMVERKSEKSPFGKGTRVIGDVRYEHHWGMTSRGLVHRVCMKTNGGKVSFKSSLARRISKEKWRILFYCSLVVVSVYLSLPIFVIGVTKVWTGQVASPADWNVDGNWTPAVVPVDGDDVLYNSTNSVDCEINVNTNNLDSFTVDTGYTGTISLGANTLQIETTADASDFTGTQGTFDAGSGTILFSGSWDTTSVSFTFTRGSSTTNATGTGTINTRDISTHAFNHLTCGASGKTTTLSSSIGIYGTLTIGAGTLTMSTTEIAYLRFATTPLVNGGTISCRITYYLDANVEILSTTYGDRLDIVLGDGYTGTLGGAITVGELLQVYGKVAEETCILDTANYNITVATSIYIGASSDLYGILDCGSSTIDQNGVPPHNVTIINSGSYILGDTSTWTFAGHWINASDHVSFDMGTSEVTADGGVTQNITTNGVAFYTVKTSGSGTIGVQQDDMECHLLDIGNGTTWRKNNAKLTFT